MKEVEFDGAARARRHRGSREAMNGWKIDLERAERRTSSVSCGDGDCRGRAVACRVLCGRGGEVVISLCSGWMCWGLRDLHLVGFRGMVAEINALKIRVSGAKIGTVWNQPQWARLSSIGWWVLRHSALL